MTNKIIYDTTSSETLAFAAQELESYLSRMLPEYTIPGAGLYPGPRWHPSESRLYTTFDGKSRIFLWAQAPVFLFFQHYLHTP